METNHFSLLFKRVTADLPIPDEQQLSAVMAAQNTFEGSRREGASIQEALESAESTLLETVTPVLEAASRLKDILATDFEGQSELASQPHFPRLLQKFMPLLVEPQSRLADSYIAGLIVEYTEKDDQHGV